MILSSLHSQLFHSRNDRLVRKWRSQVVRIHQAAQEFSSLEDADFPERTRDWRARLSEIENEQERERVLGKLVPSAFGLALEASRRLAKRSKTSSSMPGDDEAWEMVFHDCQLMGGLAMREGYISEMGTGEGKTLTATLPAYLGALTGRGVHLVTVNDYLAKRDAEWMGRLYRFLGVSVGSLQTELDAEERREVYGCDVVYGTASEFGFDYLRDHCTAMDPQAQVQPRQPYLALIDEIDSVLVDEARTPLIVTGPAAEDRTEAYRAMCRPVRRMVAAQRSECDRLLEEAKWQLGAGDEREAASLLYQVQLALPRHPRLRKMVEDPRVRRLLEKESIAMSLDHRQAELASIKQTLYFSQDVHRRTIDLSERGARFLSPLVSDAGDLFDDMDRSESEPLRQARAARVHAVNQLLRAFALYERDQDYQVTGGRVVIIDPERGRAMDGRRWNEGLHQAVEVKEGVEVQPETSTMATITLQNYFRLYPKMVGMTGTAVPAEQEFSELFGLAVASIPPHKPSQRRDHPDRFFRSKREKFAAVIDEIVSASKTGRPVLVGTAHVSDSEALSRLLRRKGIRHRVLNARRHAQEAEVIAQAGARGAVTVSTNMAGRGTDIRLGEGVAALGGLYVIGLERHASPRVDLQLRGRSGRQGDPGSSRFFLSLEDDLFKRFGHSDRLMRRLEKVPSEDLEREEHGVLERAFSRAQQQLEEHHRRGRQVMLKMDDVLHAQRSEIYGWREDILTQEPRPLIEDLMGKDRSKEDQEAWRAYQDRWASAERGVVDGIERSLLLAAVDAHWREHLETLEALKEDVFLEVVAQRDPLLEFRRRAYQNFDSMTVRLRERLFQNLYRVRMRQM